jgi:23S rRNA pseudouridine2457 synthase
MHRYFIIYKPFNVLSQFSSDSGKQTLKNYFDVPSNVYAVGRLDEDSEGLLILTDDAQLNHRLLHPLYKHARVYWAQVEGLITPAALNNLAKGVSITVNGKQHITLPATATAFNVTPAVFERVPPVRFRRNIPTSWLQLTLTEGKNRQVRKMTAAVGYPTLRLIRYSIEKLTIDGLAPGEMKALSKNELYSKLF